MGNQHAIARELINEQITPNEERAYLTWMAARPAAEVKAMQERAVSRSIASQQAAPDDGLWVYFGAAQEAAPWNQALRQIINEARKLAESKVDAASAPAMYLASATGG